MSQRDQELIEELKITVKGKDLAHLLREGVYCQVTWDDSFLDYFISINSELEIQTGF